MNRYTAIGIISLLIIIVALPIYATRESARMEQTAITLRQKRVDDGSILYVKNCAPCHGAAGEGIGAMPALNNPNLAQADHQALFKVISRAAHGSTMAAWHVEEGGTLNDYQIDDLVYLIRYADWPQVSMVADDLGFVPVVLSTPESNIAYMEGEGEADPHQCVACHEEPIVHADKFGINCARCHSTQAWIPALLTKHTFPLDHGSEDQLACQTCHVVNYFEHDCYQCHDHEPEPMEAIHLDEGVADLANCAQCHPTGVEGEAAGLGYGRSGKSVNSN